jgi:hypothetical protein
MQPISGSDDIDANQIAAQTVVPVAQHDHVGSASLPTVYAVMPRSWAELPQMAADAPAPRPSCLGLVRGRDEVGERLGDRGQRPVGDDEGHGEGRGRPQRHPRQARVRDH